jgi:hypothetical protein
LENESTIAKAKHVAMMAQGACEGERQNNVAFNIVFVLVYCIGVGKENC